MSRKTTTYNTPLKVQTSDIFEESDPHAKNRRIPKDGAERFRHRRQIENRRIEAELESELSDVWWEVS